MRMSWVMTKDWGMGLEVRQSRNLTRTVSSIPCRLLVRASLWRRWA